MADFPASFKVRVSLRGKQRQQRGLFSGESHTKLLQGPSGKGRRLSSALIHCTVLASWVSDGTLVTAESSHRAPGAGPQGRSFLSKGHVSDLSGGQKNRSKLVSCAMCVSHCSDLQEWLWRTFPVMGEAHYLGAGAVHLATRETKGQRNPGTLGS